MSNVPKSSAGAATKNTADAAAKDAAAPAPRGHRDAPRDPHGEPPRRDGSVNVANAPRSGAPAHGDARVHGKAHEQAHEKKQEKKHAAPDAAKSAAREPQNPQGRRAPHQAG